MARDGRLAKHVLGLANSGGGCILIGVEESKSSITVPCGLGRLRDKAEVDAAIRRYVPEVLAGAITAADFSFAESEYPLLKGKLFQVVFVPDLPEHVPFLAIAETTEVPRNAVFVRRLASTEQAGYEDLQRLISRKIETRYSSLPELELKRHLEDLHLLYSHLESIRVRDPFDSIGTFSIMGRPLKVERHEDFLSRAIVAKRKVIADMLRYALTTHKAQGMTVENSFVLTGDSMTGRELTYVQASRAREDTRWFACDALEDVTERMKRSCAKEAAVSLRETSVELGLTLNR